MWGLHSKRILADVDTTRIMAETFGSMREMQSPRRITIEVMAYACDSSFHDHESRHESGNWMQEFIHKRYRSGDTGKQGQAMKLRMDHLQIQDLERSTWHGLETLQNHAGKWVVGKMVYGALNYVSYRMHTPRLSRHCAGNDPRVHRPLIERSWSPFDYLQILLSISVYWAYETEFGWEWPSIRVCRGLWTWFIAYVGPDAIILDNFVVPISLSSI